MENGFAAVSRRRTAGTDESPRRILRNLPAAAEDVSGVMKRSRRTSVLLLQEGGGCHTQGHVGKRRSVARCGGVWRARVAVPWAHCPQRAPSPFASPHGIFVSAQWTPSPLQCSLASGPRHANDRPLPATEAAGVTDLGMWRSTLWSRLSMAVRRRGRTQETVVS